MSCLDFAEAKRRADGLVVGYPYRAGGSVVALVLQKRSGRVMYRVETNTTGRVGSYSLNR
jgi:hypothetical protein